MSRRGSRERRARRRRGKNRGRNRPVRSRVHDAKDSLRRLVRHGHANAFDPRARRGVKRDHRERRARLRRLRRRARTHVQQRTERERRRVAETRFVSIVPRGGVARRDVEKVHERRVRRRQSRREPSGVIVRHVLSRSSGDGVVVLRGGDGVRERVDRARRVRTGDGTGDGTGESDGERARGSESLPGDAYETFQRRSRREVSGPVLVRVRSVREEIAAFRLPAHLRVGEFRVEVRGRGGVKHPEAIARALVDVSNESIELVVPVPGGAVREIGAHREHDVTAATALLVRVRALEPTSLFRRRAFEPRHHLGDVVVFQRRFVLPQRVLARLVVAVPRGRTVVAVFAQ